MRSSCTFHLVLAASLSIALLSCSESNDPVPAGQTPAPTATSNVRLFGTLSAFGGAYPSDMTLGGSTGPLARTIFVNDEATVTAASGANVIPVDVLTPGFANSSVFAPFNVQKTQLLRNNGSPVGASDTFGAYSSDPTTDQICIVSETAGFLLCSAGMGTDAATTGIVATLTVFNPTTGSHVQTVNLALDLDFTGKTRSDGTSLTGNVTLSNPSGAAFAWTGPTTGKAYVSMSNLHDYPWGGSPVYNPGTVLVFSVDLSAPAPVATAPAAVIWTTTFNPVHVTAYSSPDTARTWILATNAGVVYSSGLPYSSLYVSKSTIDVLNTQNDSVRTTIDMGLAALSFNAIAISRDLTGRTVGMIGSSFFGNAYAIELSGLDVEPESPAGVKALRSAYNPVQVFQSAGTSHTWACDVALSARAGWAFVTAYNQAQVHVVRCPADWSAGEFEAHPSDCPEPLSFTAASGGTPSVSRIVMFNGASGGPDMAVLQSNTAGWPPNGGEYSSIGAMISNGRAGQ